MTDVSMLAAIDVDEDGRMDIIAQSKDKKGKGKILFLYNYFINESAFYLKSMMLFETKKPGEEEKSLVDQIFKEDQFGQLATGASFRFVITDTNDKKHVLAGSQLAQSSYNSLLPPYLLMAIGVSNNYIEHYNAGITMDGKV